MNSVPGISSEPENSPANFPAILYKFDGGFEWIWANLSTHLEAADIEVPFCVGAPNLD